MSLISGSLLRTTGIPIPDPITSGSEYIVTLLEGPGYLTLESERDNRGFYTSSNFSSVSSSNMVSTIFGENIIGSYTGYVQSGSLVFIADQDIPANNIYVKVASFLQNPIVEIRNSISPAIQAILDSLEARSTVIENIQGTTLYLESLEDDGLLDKASILVTPTSYSTGLIHAAVPIPGYENSPELLANGGFDTNTDWNTSFWTIGGGTASMPTTSAYKPLYQDNVTVPNKEYILTFDIISITGIIKVTSINNGATANEQIISLESTIGSKEIIFIASDTAIAFARDFLSTASCTIDNVSLKEVIGSADLDVVRNTIATRVNEQGLIETVSPNVPRLDYTDPLNPSWLLEPKRININTNYLIQDWEGQHQKTINFGISPEGVQNSTELVNLGTDNTGTAKMYPVVNGKTYTFSLYLKLNYGVLGNKGNVYIYPNSNNAKISFGDLTSEWKRYSVTYVSAMTGNQTFQIRTDVPSSIEVYGVQLEEGSYATSIIPTLETAVTRNADFVSRTGLSNYINSSEGVFYLETESLFNDGSNRFISLLDTDVPNYNTRIGFRYDTGNRIRFFVIVNNIFSCDFTYFLPDATNFAKIALSYKENNFALWVNGVKVGTDNSGVTPPANSLDTLAFAELQIPVNPFYGGVKNLQVLNTLTDAELALLTGTLDETYYTTYLDMSNTLNYTIK